MFGFGNKIGTVLKLSEPMNTLAWKPIIRLSSSTTEEVLAVENQQFEIEFKANYNAYSKRLQTYENNSTKAYALLGERCNKARKNKIKVRSDQITLGF